MSGRRSSGSASRRAAGGSQPEAPRSARRGEAPADPWGPQERRQWAGGQLAAAGLSLELAEPWCTKVESTLGRGGNTYTAEVRGAARGRCPSCPGPGAGMAAAASRFHVPAPPAPLPAARRPSTTASTRC